MCACACACACVCICLLHFEVTIKIVFSTCVSTEHHLISDPPNSSLFASQSHKCVLPFTCLQIFAGSMNGQVSVAKSPAKACEGPICRRALQKQGSFTKQPLEFRELLHKRPLDLFPKNTHTPSHNTSTCTLTVRFEPANMPMDRPSKHSQKSAL